MNGEGKGGVGADSRLGPEHLLRLNRVEFWQNSDLWGLGALFNNVQCLLIKWKC